MKERLRVVTGALRAQSFWLVLGATSAVVILVAFWTGRGALEGAAAWRERAADTARTEALAAEWVRELEPVAPAESAAWRASAEAVAERGIVTRDRVALMQTVAETAERLGLRDLGLNFVSADTIAGAVERELDGDVFEAAPYALSLSGITDTRTLVRLVDALPPQVELVRLDAVAVPEGIEARMLMLVFFAGREATDAR